MVLLHDFLISKGGIATSDGPLKSSILRNRARLSAEFTRARLKRGFATKAALVSKKAKDPPRFPRWVRINNLKASQDILMEGAFAHFIPVEKLEDLYPVGDAVPNKVYFDPYVKDLLAFAPGAPLLKHPLKRTGAIALQDRASCVPAQLLNPPSDAYVVDATAAPGNKTSHLASILGKGSTGKIFAFEKDRKRSFLLESTVKAAGAEDLVEIRVNDFLRSEPWRATEANALGKVTHLMLDPSCSGSGIVERHEYRYTPPNPASSRFKSPRNLDGRLILPSNKSASAVEYEDSFSRGNADTERLLYLSDFQQRVIEHAMRFPMATRITYSTCSVHPEENERVVMAIQRTPVAMRRGWRVEGRYMNGMKDWERRGLVEECGGNRELAESCIRFEPWTDGGIGFFVVVFVRDPDSGSGTYPVLRWNETEEIKKLDTGAEEGEKLKKTSLEDRAQDPAQQSEAPFIRYFPTVNSRGIVPPPPLQQPVPPLIVGRGEQASAIFQVLRRSTETTPRLLKVYTDEDGAPIEGGGASTKEGVVTTTSATREPAAISTPTGFTNARGGDFTTRTTHGPPAAPTPTAFASAGGDIVTVSTTRAPKQQPQFKTTVYKGRADGPKIIRGGERPKKLTKREKQREKQQKREAELALTRPIKVRERQVREGSYAEVFDDDLDYVMSRAKSIEKRQASEGNLARLKPVNIPLDEFERRDFTNLDFSPKVKGPDEEKNIEARVQTIA